MQMGNDFSLADFTKRFYKKEQSIVHTHDDAANFNSDLSISYHLMGAANKAEPIDYHAPTWKKAAVLITVIDHNDGAKILFTERSSKLRNHSGQISFPGGRVDSSDKNDIDAALREAREEIALQDDNVAILGKLPSYFTGTGYKIAPIVAALQKQQDFIANPTEVEKIFEVPMAFLMDPKNHQKMHKEIDGKQRSWYALYYKDYVIWGATAGMIVHLYERLYA